MTLRDKITRKAKELLAASPDGIRFSELVNRLEEAIPGEAHGNFTGAIWNLDARFPNEIYKPSRGLFRLIRYRPDDESSTGSTTTSESETDEVREASFYQPFADWLVNDIEECTAAIALGGNRFREKWGTPDTFGIFKGRDIDVIKLPIQVVAAEIKIDTNQLITAFGQACAYRLFAHKSYLVIPAASQKEDIDRLDSLCMIFGIGFILFDATSPATPVFQIRVRAAKYEPDSFYANKYLKMVADDLRL